MTTNTFTIFSTFFFLFLIAGCDSATEEERQPITDAAHNARNSLDYHGTYTGITPCASCEGIETSLSVYEDGSYLLQVFYIGKEDSIFKAEGNYSWNDAGNTITLDGIEAGERPSDYFVAENHLIQLDMDGKRVEGDLSEMYLLLKNELYNGTGPDMPLSETRWQVTRLNNKEIKSEKFARSAPFIIFSEDELRVHGTGGCNSFNGGYEQGGENNIHFTPLASTKMACPEMDTEQDFFRAIELTSHFEIRGNHLLFFNKGLAPVVVFEALSETDSGY